MDTKKLSYFRIVWFLLFLFFFILMLEITIRYFPFKNDVAFLQIKQTEVEGIPFYLPIFYIHVYSSIFVLLAGFTQFNSFFLNHYKALHRKVGYLYITTVLLLSSPSGLFIGLFANGGLLSKISFILLAILWFVFTLKALQYVKRKDFKTHRNFMLRSFALACSAITLRLWKVILVYLWQPSPMDVYQIIAWLGWIPNLLLAEWIIKNKN